MNRDPIRVSILGPSSPISGKVALPPDKSVSHRAAMLAALAQGSSRIDRYSMGEDCARTTSILRALGVSIDRLGEGIEVGGAGLNGFHAPDGILDAGNSGTTMRLLSGILAGQPFPTEISGDRSLNNRPMERILEPLSRMGARCSSNAGYPPLRIQGGDLQGIDYQIPVPSAQVKSCLLLAGLFAQGPTRLLEVYPTRDHTERALRRMGAKLVRDERWLVLEPEAPLLAVDTSVPGDASAAAPFLALAASLPGSEVRLESMGINPGRTGFIKLLQRMGASIQLENERIISSEPVADVRLHAAPLSGVVIRSHEVPALIDELPLVALLGCVARGTTRVRGAAELRIKESDRIRAVVDLLDELGATIRQYEDGFEVEGPQALRAAPLHAGGDHRMAMVAAVGASLARGTSNIEGFDCVGVSFPGFLDELRKILPVDAVRVMEEE